MNLVTPRFAPVSVVIPCYKCGDTIERAVNSVYNQTLRPSEVILVDDCSPDSTVSTLRQVERQYPNGWIKLVLQSQNGGPACARNAGWDSASNEYIAFLDADDVWHPKKIFQQYKWMSINSSYVLSGHSISIIGDDQDFSSMPIQSDFSAKKIDLFLMLLSNRILTSSVMLKRDLSARFRSEKRFSEDYLLWLTIVANGNCARSTNALAYSFKGFFGVGGLSGNLWRMTKGEIDTYKSLHSLRIIRKPTYLALQVYSLLKHVRRVLLTKLR